MSTVTVEADERRKRLEEQAQVVTGLLKEYAAKLAVLNIDLFEAIRTRYSESRIAWLLDRGELLRKPLGQIISRGSGLLEHADLETLTDDELALRMQEVEIHLHHALRLTHELKHLIEKNKAQSEAVAKLRVAAGLSGMKGGPLRPE